MSFLYDHTEADVVALNDPERRRAEEDRHAHHCYAALPRILGRLLVAAGNLVYGEGPSYLKFRALEVIARVPYSSWESAVYTLLTLFYTREKIAITLMRFSSFARHAQDNETMHVVVISQIAKKECGRSFFRGGLFPVCFAFLYFWISYVLYLVNRRYALELNAIFEDHAYHQYSDFLERHEKILRMRPVASDFLGYYGREVSDEYAFFSLVRNDELLHRNASLDRIS